MATNENINSNNRLQELSGSDFEIVDGQPDIRGWDVIDSEGNSIGEVDELVFDVQARKVRYMVVDLDDDVTDSDDRDVLVPIGLAQLHDKDDDVILPGITAAQLQALPAYDKDNLTPEYETSIRNAFAGIGSATIAGTTSSGNTNADSDFYNHQHFNEDNLLSKRRSSGDNNVSVPVIEEQVQVGKRVEETGGARLTRTIVEKPVEENVNLREEHVTVDRNKVDRPATNADFENFKEGTIELTEHAEVPVVNKEARVVEEVTLTKEVQEREETIRETVRKTEVDIENLGTDTTSGSRQELRDDEDISNNRTTGI